MDRSKLFAIIALVIGLAVIVKFKEKPLPADEDHDEDAQPTAQVQNTPNFDVVGGITKLKVEEVSVGKGASAKAGDNVTVNYRGTLLNGEVFDQSYGAGKKPFEFQLGTGQVIPGWDQGIAGMRVGGKRKLTIPGSLAYGASGAPGGKIPPNATLKFDVELLKISGKG